MDTKKKKGIVSRRAGGGMTYLPDGW